MKQKDILINKLNIHLLNGWQGDPVYLARKISEQIQRHTFELKSKKQINVSLQGDFSGVANRVNQQLSGRLRDAAARNDKNVLSGDG